MSLFHHAFSDLQISSTLPSVLFRKRYYFSPQVHQTAPQIPVLVDACTVGQLHYQFSHKNT